MGMEGRQFAICYTQKVFLPPLVYHLEILVRLKYRINI